MGIASSVSHIATIPDSNPRNFFNSFTSQLCGDLGLRFWWYLLVVLALGLVFPAAIIREANQIPHTEAVGHS